MTFENTYEVQQDMHLIIQLPERFRSKKRVKVIVEEISESRREGIKLLKKASKDPLFLSDINDVASDFEDAVFSLE